MCLLNLICLIVEGNKAGQLQRQAKETLCFYDIGVLGG